MSAARKSKKKLPLRPGWTGVDSSAKRPKNVRHFTVRHNGRAEILLSEGLRVSKISLSEIIVLPSSVDKWLGPLSLHRQRHQRPPGWVGREAHPLHQPAADLDEHPPHREVDGLEESLCFPTESVCERSV